MGEGRQKAYLQLATSSSDRDERDGKRQTHLLADTTEDGRTAIAISFSCALHSVDKMPVNTIQGKELTLNKHRVGILHF